jgi:hypothetical protein
MGRVFIVAIAIDGTGSYFKTKSISCRILDVSDLGDGSLRISALGAAVVFGISEKIFKKLKDNK